MVLDERINNFSLLNGLLKFTAIFLFVVDVVVVDSRKILPSTPSRYQIGVVACVAHALNRFYRASATDLYLRIRGPTATQAMVSEIITILLCKHEVLFDLVTC